MEPSKPYSELLEYLKLEPVGPDRFLAGTRPQPHGRHFGGLIAAQAMIAAGRTIADFSLHSLHSYFLRPGAAGGEVTYVVERIKEGRNFHARSVSALQDGEHIFTMQGSYTRKEQGISHQEPMRDTPPLSDEMEDRDARHSLMGADAFEIRCVDGHPHEQPGPPQSRYWCRLKGPAPEDSGLKAALLVYLSDRCLLGAGRRPHLAEVGRPSGASLDHAAWLHREADLDDWLMYDTNSHIAEAGRPLIFGKLYQSNGRLIASVAQEGIIRPAR